MQNKRKGFTVVELLIVIVVIAILAIIMYVTYDGIQSRAYYNRSISEMSAIAKATLIFNELYGAYPADVNRDVPGEITELMDGSTSNWPKGPWPGSVYDYDYFMGSDGNEVSQISIRFCPIGGPMSACNFPKEDWATGFQVNSSLYWCITGICKPHPGENDDYPGYCANCVED